MTFPKLFEIWYFHVQIIKLFSDSNAILNFCPGDFCFIPYLVSTSKIKKDYQFPRSFDFWKLLTFLSKLTFLYPHKYNIFANIGRDEVALHFHCLEFLIRRHKVARCHLLFDRGIKVKISEKLKI